MSENQQVEWKESWHDEYLKWVCGFANAKGGMLEIGRNDKGKVVGLTNAKKLMEDLPNKMRDTLGITADVDLLEENGLEYLRISVEPYPYPVSYKGQYYYRCGSTKQELKGAALDKFLLGKMGQHWDGVPVPKVSVDELDDRAFAKFRWRASKTSRLKPTDLNGSNSALVEKLRLKTGEYLKRAAILLFHPDPEDYVPGAWIKIGYFESETDLKFHDEVHGNLFNQVNRTMDLLVTKYLKSTITYEGIQRVERLPLPIEALRETVLNAVAHKDYGSGVPTQIKVFENRVIFWNNGRLPDGWTVDRLKVQHPSQPYNPDIANAFFRAGMIEAWGRGIENMIQSCIDYGIAPPDLRYEEVGLSVRYDFADQVGTKLALSRPQVAILRKARRESSLVELMEVVDRSDRTKFRNQVIKPLFTFGLMEMTIPEKPTSSNQKYRITAQGEQVLADWKGERPT